MGLPKLFEGGIGCFQTVAGIDHRADEGQQNNQAPNQFCQFPQVHESKDAVETSQQYQTIEPAPQPNRLRYQVLWMQSKKIFEEIAHEASV